MKARYVISLTLIAVLLFSTFAMIPKPSTANAQATQQGEWIEHPFPTGGYAAAGEDCIGVRGTSTSIWFFDIYKSAWTELEFDSPQTIHALKAEGHTIFAYSDELLIGYSSLLSQWDTIQYTGTLLHDSYGCGKNLAFFVTDERMYVFDAELGYWQEYDYGLPADYVNNEDYVLKDDYVWAALLRGDEQPKNVAYSLHTHSFNQLEYGCIATYGVLDHGLAKWHSLGGDQYQLTGYSAYTNEFDVVQVSGQGNLCSISMPGDLQADEITAYLVSFRQVEPYVLVRADFYGYDTRLGYWSHITIDFDLEVESYSGGSPYEGGQFVVDWSLYDGTPRTYKFIFYSGITGQFSIITPGMALGSLLCGGTVFVAFDGTNAWAYDLITEEVTTIPIVGGLSSYRVTGDDYVTFSFKESFDSDTMTVYFYNGRTRAWTTTEMPISLTSSNYSHNEHIYVFSSSSPTRETIFYSSIVDAYVKCEFPVDSYVGKRVSGVLASASSAEKSYLFDAETGDIHEFDFKFNQGGLGDSSASFFEEDTKTLYGYSTLSRQWTTLTIDDTPYSCYNEDFIGLISTQTATKLYTKYYAYNGLKDSWVELVPTGSYQGDSVGQKTALVIRSDALYAFDPDGRPTAQYVLTVTTEGSGSVTLAPDGGIYDEGAEVQLTATADPGWVFSSWSGNLTGSDNPATITMDSDKTVTANFSELEKPDLVITDVWNDGGLICYQVSNIGEAVAPQGHYTALFIDGVEVATDLVDADLAPGERLNRCFGYEWVCTSKEDTVEVSADSTGSVNESDETNNLRDETWKCDTTPPEVVDGPGVSDITGTSAVISWVTDENSDSVVKYGKKAGVYGLEEQALTLVTEHNVALTGLEPSTVYQFVVESTDASGNTTTSKAGTFETLPLPDDKHPIVSIPDPGICRGITRIIAPASDDTGVKKVEFYLNEELIFTDYSPPYELILDTTKYVNGEYTLKAKVYDLCGRVTIADQVIDIDNYLADSGSPSVEITNPDDGDTVSGIVDIDVYASDPPAPWMGMTSPQSVNRVEFYIDGEHRCTSYPLLYTATYSWNTQTVEEGEHTIEVIAYDDAENSASDSITVTVDQPPPPEPVLVVTRGLVVRQGTGFYVSLQVGNVGDGAASNIHVVDWLTGFQALTGVDSWYYPSTKECSVDLSISHLNPDSSTSLTYCVVPILYEVAGIDLPTSYAIGTYTHLSYQGLGGESYEEDLSIPATLAKIWDYPSPYFVDVASAAGYAIAQADYLIVTNPLLLFGYNLFWWDNVNVLLSNMAHLAYLKSGVLGYLDTYDGYALEQLIAPRYFWPLPNWAKRLHPDFSTALGGYLLIVGETEIVPSWHESGFDRHWADGDVTDDVYYSDHPYADTTGDGAPDLIVGRIIGDYAAGLTKPIEASIGAYLGSDGYGFDRSDALLVSGTGNYSGDMMRNVDGLEEILDPEFSVTKIHWTDYDTSSERREAFIAEAPDKDVIYLIAHGNAASCGALYYPYLPSVSFDGTNPFVYASSCLTGNYERGPNDYGIAEAFFDRGVAVYIGSTQLAAIRQVCAAARQFFSDWDASQSIGEAFTRLERDRHGDDDWWRFWVWEYNLYGDPKFGSVGSSGSLSAMASLAGEEEPPSSFGSVGSPAASAASMMASMAGAEEPPSSLQVEIPDYVVTTIEGLDYVEIPGGYLLLEEGKPEVPYHKVSINYPQGYKVQDVVLTDRSGLFTATGLNLPITTMDILSSPGEGASSTAEGEGWFPEEEYRWDILENPDGSTTLVIIMYPFYYNSLTTNVEFYKNYSFDINYIVSTVAITSLTTDKYAYQQGDAVRVDIGVNNSGEAQDVIFNASIKRYSLDEIVDGLPLSSLDGLMGEASCSAQWDSNGFEPGYYCVEVSLEDGEGNRLDTKARVFRLGISSADITAFTAMPAYFGVGDSIDISLTLQNSGTVNISGNAVIRIRNEAGETVEEFTHEFADLAPAGSANFDYVWDTLGAAEGSYYIVGTVLYEGKAAGPVSATVVSTEGSAADNDDDGVADTEEQGPHGTDGTYDGNSDGIPDSQQANVASLHSHDGQDYVTLASPGGTTMTGVQGVDNPSPADAPAGVDFPCGFFDFTISGVEVGGATTATLYLPIGESPNTYYKYGRTPDNDTPHWYEFMYDGQTGAEINGHTIILHFVDGQRGDEDLAANGTIVEPGGPGQATGPTPTPPPTIASVSPNRGNQGETLDLTITGTNLTAANVIGFGAGVTVDSFIVDSSTRITANITIDADATTGARDVSVTTSGGTGTLPGGFTVEEKAEEDGNGGNGDKEDGNGEENGEAGGCGCTCLKADVSASELAIGWAIVGLCWGTGYCLLRRASRRNK